MMTIGIVAAMLHIKGITKSAANPREINRSQNTLFFIKQLYHHKITKILKRLLFNPTGNGTQKNRSKELLFLSRVS
jgi:hypothetical protein